MRRSPSGSAFSLLALNLALVGCASERDAGAALVGAGAIVAIVASEAASDSIVCTREACSAATSKHAAAAAAGVGAGVAIAAAGAALQDDDNASDHNVRVGSSSHATGSWRLVRAPVYVEPGRTLNEQ
jgi:hypothetical protein